jgi:hypothetical protein
MGAVVRAETPTRSLQQRMDALRRANVVRTRRADTKKAAKRGLLQPAEFFDLLVEPPEWMETMKVFDLLTAMPKLGRKKADQALRQARISPSKTLGGITARQRHDLLTLVRWRSW